jgi:hypothetical protein
MCSLSPVEALQQELQKVRAASVCSVMCCDICTVFHFAAYAVLVFPKHALHARANVCFHTQQSYPACLVGTIDMPVSFWMVVP